MIATKLFEIRDRGTFIPVMATALVTYQDVETWLLRRAGYALDQIWGRGVPYVILCKLVEIEAQYDSHCWHNQRTMGNAHRYIIEHWDELTTGAVIDVEYVLGETERPKVSERSIL